MPSETAQAREELRNLAIVAHVDHGKTTLVDNILHQTGIFRAGAEVVDRVMDSEDLERERGITILAKNCSVRYRDKTLNIIDTPGHSDFGGEVERTLRMADGFLLLVDAAEGPLPQTRFVLHKALELHLKPIVVINKIDRSDARPHEVLNEIFDLFVDLCADLDAPDEYTDFPVIYCNGRAGISKLELEDEDQDLRPLLDLIIEHVPPPRGELDAPLQMLVHNLEYDDYVGRLAVGRVWRGRIATGDTILRLGPDGEAQKQRISQVYAYEGMKRVECKSAECGDIIVVAGISDMHIGDTLAHVDTPDALPRISVDEPTVAMTFGVNTSPLSGRDGKHVTSRKIREWLHREALRNVAIRVEDTEDPDTFRVSGRGELQLSIIAERMRREDYEIALGMPQVLVREGEDGKREEPLEEVLIDVPEEHMGVVTEKLGVRRGKMIRMDNHGSGRVRITFHVPSRGLLGYRGILLTDTRGTALMHSIVAGWVPWAGPVRRRMSGALVADRPGRATPYALFHLQPRGVLFESTNTQVYEGMILGEHSRGNDLDVNVTREKKLTNMRAAGKDEATVLSTPKKMSLEEALAWIDDDELVELTPNHLRLRKRILPSNQRPKKDRSKIAESD